jgi:hypothetical protein
MATTPTATATETPTITLTAPDPVPVVLPEKAIGLVPVSQDDKSKLETKVDAFVADLVAQTPIRPNSARRSIS